MEYPCGKLGREFFDNTGVPCSDCGWRPLPGTVCPTCGARGMGLSPVSYDAGAPSPGPSSSYSLGRFILGTLAGFGLFVFGAALEGLGLHEQPLAAIVLASYVGAIGGALFMREKGFALGLFLSPCVLALVGMFGCFVSGIRI